MIKPSLFSEAGSRRLLAAAAIAVMGATAMLLTPANAAPMTPATGVATDSQVLQVRDGCGRGLRYSERRGGCVEDFDGGPGYDRGPPRDYDRRPPPPPVVYERRLEPDCGRGMRFSNSRQACVRIEGAVDDRGNNDVAAGALVGGVVGGLIGSAIQNDANRQQQQGARR